MNLTLTLNKHRQEICRRWLQHMPHQLQLNFQGVRCCISTNSQSLVELLQVGYGAFFDSKQTQADIELLALSPETDIYKELASELLPERHLGQHILIAKQFDLIYLLKDMSLLQFYVANTMFGLVVRYLRKKYLVLHGATLNYKMSGIVLCGAARCGKTVLTCLLLSKGLGYLSDDVTLVERASLCIAPFQRGINIRKEYKPLVSSLINTAPRTYELSVADQHRLIARLPTPEPKLVRPDLVIFPNFQKEKATNLEWVDSSVGFVKLMSQRFHPLGDTLEKHQADDFQCVCDMLTQVTCWQLTFSDPEDAASTLLTKIHNQEPVE